MGNTVPSRVAAQQDLLVLLQSELPDMLHLEQLGRGKFMKTLLCRRLPKDVKASAGAATDDGGSGGGEKVIIKIYLKRSEQVADRGEVQRRLGVVREQLIRLVRTFNLGTHPNILPYQRFEDNVKQDCAFLLRQYIRYTLSDRLNSRPFLTDIEKRWLMYQLIRAVAQVHAAGLRHGDIKGENVLVTSWGWLFLTDFAPFKPTFIPADDPTDFDFFFSAASHKRCYVAPERFVRGVGARAGEDVVASVTSPAPASLLMTTSSMSAASGMNGGAGEDATLLRDSMDVFSLGCVIGEILLDGDPVFDLPSLLKYRADAAFDPLKREGVQEPLRDADPTGVCTAVVAHMIQRDPAQRLSAAAYLEACTAGGKESPPPASSKAMPPIIFPRYFPYMFDFFAQLLRPDLQAPDLRVAAVCAHYSELLQELFGGVQDPLGTSVFRHRLMLENSATVRAVSFSVPSATVRSTPAGRRGVHTCLDNELRSTTAQLRFSMGAQRAQETMHALRWEWGWLDTAPWGEAYDALPLDARASCSLAYCADVGAFHEQWHMFAAPDAPTSVPAPRSSVASTVAAAPPPPPRGVSTPAVVPRPTIAERIAQLLTETEGILAAASTERATAPASPFIGASASPVEAVPSLESLPPPPLHAVPSGDVDTDGAVLLVVLLTSCLRSLSNPRIKLTALLLLSRFAAYTSDEVKLQRVTPYLMTLVSDASPVVRAHSLCALACVLTTVTDFSASDALLFQQYIFPTFLRAVSTDIEPAVQAAAAESLPRLATAARRFVDITQWKAQMAALARTARMDAAVDAEPPVVRVRNTHDADMTVVHRRVQAIVQKWITVISNAATGLVNSASMEDVSTAASAAAADVAADVAALLSGHGLVDARVLQRFTEALSQLPLSADTSLVKHALLRSSVALCAFFGRSMTEEFLLPVFFTFVVDPAASTALTSLGPALVPQLLPLASVDFKILDRPGENGSLPEVLTPSLMSVVLGWLTRSPLGSGDWVMRDTFLRQLVKMADIVGPSNTEHSLLPFIEQPVNDVQEPLAYRALVCLSALVQSRYLHGTIISELLHKHAALLLHPSRWLRRGALRLCASAVVCAGWPDALVKLHTTLNPLLRAHVGDHFWRRVAAALIPSTGSERVAAVEAVSQALETCTLRPLSRASFDAEMTRIALGTIGAASPALLQRYNMLAAHIAQPSSRTPRKVSNDSGVVFQSSLRDMGVAPSTPQGEDHEDGESVDDDGFTDDEGDEDDDTRTAREDELHSTFSGTPHHAREADSAMRSAMALLRGPNGDALFNVTRYAAPLRGTHARSYALEKLRTYMTALAGPYRMSIACSGRLQAAAAAATAATAAAAAPGTDAYTVLPAALLRSISAASKDTRGNDTRARALESVRAAVRAHSDREFVRSVLAGEFTPQLPYPDEQLAQLPLRSISVPDQRYASVHPQPPATAAARTPNPHDEGSRTLAVVATSDARCVHATTEDALPVVCVSDAAGVASASGTASSDDIHVLANVPHWLNSAYASAPLPEDAAEYCRRIQVYSRASASAAAAPRTPLVLARGISTSTANAAARDVGAPCTEMLLIPLHRRPGVAAAYLAPTALWAGPRRVSQLVASAGSNGTPAPPAGDEAVTTAPGTAGAVVTSRGSFLTFGEKERNASRISFSMDAYETHRGSSFLLPESGPSGTRLPVDTADKLGPAPCPAEALLRIRREWRRAGRVARRMFLRHGIWDPLLVTDTHAPGASAGSSGAAGAPSTAFFYASQRGAAADDPTLQSSDEDDASQQQRRAVVPVRAPMSSSLQPMGAATVQSRGSLPASAGAMGPSSLPPEGSAPALDTRTSSDQGAGMDDGTSRHPSDVDDDGSGAGDGGGDAPVIIGPAAARQNPRVTPSSVAARYSGAAQAAIMASDGSWLQNRLAAWAASTGVSLPALMSVGPDRAVGSSSVVGFTIANRYDIASRKRASRIGRTYMRLRARAGSVTGDGMDDMLAPGDGGEYLSVPGMLGALGSTPASAAGRAGASVSRALQVAQFQRRAAAAATAAVGDSGKRTQSLPAAFSGIADGSYVGDAFGAETYVDKALGPSRADAGVTSGAPQSSATPAPTVVAGVSIIPQYSAGRSSAYGSRMLGEDAGKSGSPSVNGGTAAPSTTSALSGSSKGRDERDYLNPDAVTSLRRRVGALQLPPLPPNLGALQKLQSDPPVAIVAHAVRVALKVAEPDSLSSVAAGVGGGNVDVLRTVPVPPGISVALDEAYNLGVDDDADVAACMDVVPGDALPSATMIPPPPPAPSGLTDEYDIVRMSSSGGMQSPGVVTSLEGMASGRLQLVPMPYPLPQTEDIVRPTDVGDATGVVGAGRISFMGVERGWRDGVGIGPPSGAPLAAAIGLSGDPMAPEGISERQRLDSRSVVDSVRLSMMVDAGGRAAASLLAGSGDGARGAAAAASRAGAVVGAAGGWDGGDGSWGSRPRGLLLSTCAEHAGAVTALATCQDHTFFASGSEDGTVKIWSSRHIERDVAPAAVITYAGHLQETRYGDPARGIRPGRNRVTDVLVCDNSCSVASASAAGTVHVWRVDVASARSARAGGAAAAGSSSGPSATPMVSQAIAFPEYITSAGVRDDAGGMRASQANTRGSFLRSASGADGKPRHSSGLDTSSDPGRGSDWDADADAALPSVARTSVKPCDGVALVRRLVFDASEGPVTAIRHYQSATESVLAVAMRHGVLHGCDLRARSEAWSVMLPPVLGCVSAMEMCPGSTNALVGTDRGVLAIVDCRFNMIISAWRHSSRTTINAIYPYVTVDVRSDGGSTAFNGGGGGPIYGTGGERPALAVSRQLAAGIATSEGEVSFWNLETGTCTRVLRTLPPEVHPADAYRVPFLSRITLAAGRVSAADAAALRPRKPARAFAAAAKDLGTVVPSPCAVRAMLCPLGSTSRVSGGRDGDGAGGRAYNDLVNGGGDEDGSGRSAGDGAGLGCTLAGVRGAGAARRRENPFALGYAAAGAAASPDAATVADACAFNPASVVYTYGSTLHEGLPVWMLTTGSDACVRCWDLDRPRASHTVCGHAPGAVREAYDGAWLSVPPFRAWHVDDPVEAGEGDVSSGSDAEDCDDDDDGGDEQRDAFAPTPLRRARHFINRFTSDGMSALPHTRQRGGGLSSSFMFEPSASGALASLRQRVSRYAYTWQQRKPVRCIFSQDVYDPTKDADVMGVGGVTSAPQQMLKGPMHASTRHDAPVTAMAWLDAPMRLLLTGAEDGVVKVWR